MKPKILIGIESVGRERWADFLADHPQRTIFQSPEMHDLYREAPNFAPVVIAIEGGDGMIKGILLAVNIKDYKGIVGDLTVRTVVYGGPLIIPGDANAEAYADRILEALIEAVESRTLYIQFRNSYDMTSLHPAFLKHRFIQEDHLNLIVATSDSEKAHSEISKSKIRQAKSSLAAGVELVPASSEEEIRQFYLILEEIYKDKAKKPLPHRAFFLSFYRATQKGKLGIVLLAKYQGMVIGGMVCPITEGKALNEWYICGLDKMNSKIHPSVLLTYGAIEYAITNKIPNFDFMGIGSPGKPYGVREFKTRFGGQSVNYGRYMRISNPYLYRIASAWYSALVYLHLI
jgi:serine/alanine adding enzyme